MGPKKRLSPENDEALSLQLAREMAERKKVEAAFQESLLFEQLISNLSARFINLPADRIDSEIELALKMVLDFLQVDRCGLLRTLQGKERWIITHAAIADGVPPVAVQTELPATIFPWTYQKMSLTREVVAFSRLDDLPAEAQVDKETYRAWGIRSNLSIPILNNETVDHFIVINAVKSEHVWPDTLIPRLQLLGEVFVNALERRSAELALREGEETLRLATASAEMGLWSMDIKTEVVWITDTLRELFQFSPEEPLSFGRFMERIHPDDRENVKTQCLQSIQNREFFKVDYRILLPDGSIRWIATRGGPFPRLPGQERLMGVSTDITERKQTELQLKRSETSLTTLINSTSDMIWSVDAKQFGLLTFNHGLYDYFLKQRGISIEAGMRPEDLFPSEEYIEKWRSFYQQALDRGSFTTEYLVFAGNRTLRLNLNVLKANDAVFGVSVFGQDVTDLKRMESQLREQLAEIGRLQARVEDENLYLREEIKRGDGFEKIVGQSDVLKYVLFRAAQVASTDATVLILGETGTGKGMVARAIHEMSPRKHKQMITVNCAALPANLIESELFGREKGAFTGAHARQVGRFEVANGGTIFLDEIGEMPLELQAKLLRVLQDGEFERLGSPNIIKVDVRVIGATSRDLKDDIKNGRFREDLFYRLNIFLVSIPPLRARVEDIPQLVNHFVEKYARKYGKRFETVPKSTLHVLQQYHWPGNVREMENVIMRAIITSPGPVLQLADRLEPENVGGGEDQLKDLESMEREHILRVLAKTRWKVDGEGGASSILGMNPSTLRFRIKKLGIQRP